MDKFKMELTWHNCATCPPEEDFNHDLFFTNGTGVMHGWYSIYCGYNLHGVDKEDQPQEYHLPNLWWADITRTLTGKSHGFKEETK